MKHLHVRKSFWLFLFLLSIYSFSEAQGDVVTFSSPNVATFNKFGSIPVSYYTGTPNISIPLYTINEGDINLPISLNYNASGIKVNEPAPWCGLGWNLDYGGMISREVRDMPDDGPNGYLVSNSSTIIGNVTNNTASYIPPARVLSPLDISKDLLQSVDGLYYAPSGPKGDGQADIFRFTCLKHNGIFFFNKNKQVIQAPLQNLSIQGWTSANTNVPWQITTPEGLKFIYGNNVERIDYGMGNQITALFLNEIDDQNGNSIVFKYQNYFCGTQCM